MREFIKEKDGARYTKYLCNCQESFVKEQTELYKATYEDPKLLKRVINDMKKSILATGWLVFILSFLLTMSSLSYAEPSAVFFSDVTNNHWAYKFIDTLKTSEIIGGYPEGTFRPEANVKINEFIAMSVKALGYRFESTSSDWSKPYIDKAIELGIIEDREFTSYTANITREQMTSIVVNAVALSEYRPSSTMDDYIKRETIDYYKVSDYYKQNILDSYKFGIVTGFSDHTFRPKDYSTRAQAAAVISKIENMALRKPFEKTDANYVMMNVSVSDEFGNYENTQLPFYAPYYNGKPVDEIVEFAKLVNDIHYNGKGFIYFGYDSSLNHLGSGFYRDKATYDYYNSLSSSYENVIALADNIDFSLTIYPYDLGSKYKPYQSSVLKMTEYTMNYTNYSTFFNEHYKEQFEAMFKFWFEDEFDTAWTIFNRALDYTGERKNEIVTINGRNFDIGYSRLGMTFYVSLKH